MLLNIDDYDWDNLMCNWCRRNKADLLHDDGNRVEPLCIDCAEVTLDRYSAVSMNPELAHLLPPLRER